jgi:hypothetical protein
MEVNIRIIDGGEEDCLMFQIVRLELNNDSNVVARQRLQPPYELWEDAMALAEFDASRCAGEYDFDNEYECWCATDGDRRYRFVVEPVASLRQS